MEAESEAEPRLGRLICPDEDHRVEVLAAEWGIERRRRRRRRMV